MKYELYNNHEVHENIILISINTIETILEMYNNVDEISNIMNKCKNEPKNTWISKGDNLPRFNVPLLRVDDDNQFKIVDGRHRIFLDEEASHDEHTYCRNHGCYMCTIQQTY
ncbi:TPA: hypothetical protein U2I61_003809 [Providencia rettgeri]|nr:hypothetical protein [Providencia rettgeri]